jgi:hypothetical protein
VFGLHPAVTKSQGTFGTKIFKDATLFFSCSTPNLATVIPAMDHIDEMLATQSRDSHFEPSIRVALSIAKKTLNSYYDKTDHSETYQIAMSEHTLYFSLFSTSNYPMLVLHPCHKLRYFENAGWERQWITDAEQILRDEFERSYAGNLSPSDGDSDDNAMQPVADK